MTKRLSYQKSPLTARIWYILTTRKSTRRQIAMLNHPAGRALLNRGA